MIQLIKHSAEKLELIIDEESIAMIADTGTGIPRETISILKRVNDFAHVYQDGVITKDLTEKVLGLMEANGLKKRDND